MIEVKGLYKTYGINAAVRNVSFTARKGEIVGLGGRNGAGKSTTMNIIAGYISSDEGTVTINGHDILKEPVEAKRHLGYMPEFPPLYNEMTVYKYLHFVCQLMGVPKNDIRDHLKDIIENVGLVEVQNRLIGNLSKGYRQRVGIAKALCGNPENIMLDEPTSGLDPKQIVEIRALIRSLGKKHTVIISSHILSELVDICTRLVIIDRGVVLADDTVEHLLSPSGSGRVLELAARDGEDLYAVLANIDGVAEVKKKKPYNGAPRYYITIKPGADVAETVSRAVAQAGATVTLLRPVEHSLEDVFLELTEAAMRKEGKDA
ncbi:MAG: ATP-binding cassette domain-containing protein [Christensenellaceae bacterium]|nr:ATP-binding cassette domain-containing protein [Christensenellaceae bacterium]